MYSAFTEGKMSDTDSSSEEHSSTESTTDSSDDEKLETVQACGRQVQIPQGLCEKKDVLREFLSMQMWSSLSDTNKQHLSKFLPTFPENDEQEKSNTMQKLLGGEVFRFNNPLDNFHEHLKAGHFRPDIAKMRYMIRKAERKEAKHRYRRLRKELEGEVLESRRNLLNLVRTLPPGVEPRVERSQVGVQSVVSPVVYRTRRRYFQELASIRGKVDEAGFSSDENYPDGPPTSLSRKQKRVLNGIRSSILPGNERFVCTMASKPNFMDLERNITPNSNPFFVTDETYKYLLINHKRRKLEKQENLELNTKGINLTDIIHRTKLAYVKRINVFPTNSVKAHGEAKIPNKKRHKKMENHVTHSTELMNRSNPFFGHSSNSEQDSDSDSLLDSVLTNNTKSKRTRFNKVKTEKVTDHYFNVCNNSSEKVSSPNSTNNFTKSSFMQYGNVTPATFSDLAGIDMMNLPIDLDDSNIDIMDEKPELMQETHASFLSLIRDIICSTVEQRMSFPTLEERLKVWQENPISPLNDWYNKVDNWVVLLQSAINFLSGSFPEQPSDFVPYIEYKPQFNVYQWIGAGRDTDISLLPLSKYWLDHRNQVRCYFLFYLFF